MFIGELMEFKIIELSIASGETEPATCGFEEIKVPMFLVPNPSWFFKYGFVSKIGNQHFMVLKFSVTHTAILGNNSSKFT